MNQPFEVVITDPGKPIDLREFPIQFEMKPIKLFIKPDGSLSGEPTYCWLMQDAGGTCYVSQISHKMFTDALEAAKNAAEIKKSLHN